MAKNTKAKDALSMFDTAGIAGAPNKPAPKTKEDKPTDSKQKKAEEESRKATIPTPEQAPKKDTAKTVSLPKSSGMTNIGSISLSMKKQVSKSRTRSFYMSDEIYEKLRSLAEKNGACVSEYLEYILAQVMGLS